MDNQEWLKGKFQTNIESSLQLAKQQASEQTPYMHKYTAINKLKQLLEEQYPYKFIVHYQLGEIYSDVQQITDSLKSYQNALEGLEQLPNQQKNLFYNYFVRVYNMMGLNLLNKDEHEKGLNYLQKSVEIYQQFCLNKGLNCYHNQKQASNERQFLYYYQGGNNHEQMQDSHTLTLFYLAQGYTKNNEKHKAAEYCGMTLQRQYSTKKYQLKDFCYNLMGLAEYYQSNNYFAQSQYLLLLAEKVIPLNKKKKLRAKIEIALGNLISSILEFNCNKLKSNINEQDNKKINKQLLIFVDFEQKFNKIKLAQNLQQCKSYFRMANTQYRKAKQIFVLDGYVTQHIEILMSQSNLYLKLSLLEKNRQRIVSMLEKRRELLEPILKQINPKAYIATWQKILVEVSQILNDLFNIQTIITIDTKTNHPKLQKMLQMIKIGKAAVLYYQEIIKVLKQDKQSQRNQQYFRSIINAKFNIAKISSKFIHQQVKIRIQFLKKSYNYYKDLLKYIEQQIPKQLRIHFEKQIQLTHEMISMMPTKIDRINTEQIKPWD